MPEKLAASGSTATILPKWPHFSLPPTAKSMSEQGYSLVSSHRQVFLAACFSRWLKQKQIRLRSIERETWRCVNVGTKTNRVPDRCAKRGCRSRLWTTLKSYGNQQKTPW